MILPKKGHTSTGHWEPKSNRNPLDRQRLSDRFPGGLGQNDTLDPPDSPLSITDVIAEFKAAFGVEGEKVFHNALHHNGAILCGQFKDAPGAHMHITAYAICQALKYLKSNDSESHREFARQERAAFINMLEEKGVKLTGPDGETRDMHLTIELAVAHAIKALNEHMNAPQPPTNG